MKIFIATLLCTAAASTQAFAQDSKNNSFKVSCHLQLNSGKKPLESDWKSVTVAFPLPNGDDVPKNGQLDVDLQGYKLAFSAQQNQSDQSDNYPGLVMAVAKGDALVGTSFIVLGEGLSFEQLGTSKAGGYLILPISETIDGVQYDGIQAECILNSTVH